MNYNQKLKFRQVNFCLSFFMFFEEFCNFAMNFSVSVRCDEILFDPVW